jgi:bifunctional non-homologous end joining protein LigD
VQLLTRIGLDWTDKYPSAIAAFENVRAKTAYLDGELCGVDYAGLPSFATHDPVGPVAESASRAN